MKRLTKKAIDESGIAAVSTENEPNKEVSVTSSAFIRRKINETAHAILPKSNGDLAIKNAEN